MSETPDPRTDACPLCSCEEASTVGEKQGHAYWRCADCDLIYAPELPSEEEFAQAYGKYRTRKRVVSRKVIKLAPMILGHRMRTAMRGRKQPMRFLDIGSNTGYNTEAARRLGCEAHGLETSAKAVAFAREEYPYCTFHEGFIEEFAELDERFDFIYCSEVIEHVPEPHAFVEALAKLSHQGTCLFITTPDAGHWKVPEDLMSWKEVIPVEHLRLYDRQNLARLLGMHGIRIDRTTPVLRANQRHYCSLVTDP